jgi:tetratricopeptide (TPR) repeat protein
MEEGFARFVSLGQPSGAEAELSRWPPLDPALFAVHLSTVEALRGNSAWPNFSGCSGATPVPLTYLAVAVVNGFRGWNSAALAAAPGLVGDLSLLLSSSPSPPPHPDGATADVPVELSGLAAQCVERAPDTERSPEIRSAVLAICRVGALARRGLLSFARPCPCADALAPGMRCSGSSEVMCAAGAADLCCRVALSAAWALSHHPFAALASVASGALAAAGAGLAPLTRLDMPLHIQRAAVSVLSVMLLRLGRADESLALLSSLRPCPAPGLRASALLALGREAEAAQAFVVAARGGLRDSPSLYNSAGCVLAETGHPREALEALTEAVRSDGSCFRAMGNAARILGETGGFAAEAQMLGYLVREGGMVISEPASAAAKRRMAAALLAGGDYKAAVLAYEACVKEGFVSKAPVAVMRGWASALLKLGAVRQAAAVASAGLASHPNDPFLMLCAADAALSAGHDATELYTRARAALPARGPISAAAAVNLAVAKYAQGSDLGECLELLDAAIAEDPLNDAAALNKSVMLLRSESARDQEKGCTLWMAYRSLPCPEAEEWDELLRTAQVAARESAQKVEATGAPACENLDLVVLSLSHQQFCTQRR